MVIGVIFLILLILLMLIFKPLWILNYLAPQGHCKRIKNLPYALEKRHNLDLYIPKKIDVTKPVLVFIHGGSWDTGRKEDYLFAGYALSELGYITAIPNYRLYPQVQFPHFVEDVGVAVSSLPLQLKEKNITFPEPLSVVLIGHSAGAHTAAMLVSNNKYHQKLNEDVQIKALIGLAGPYDLPLDDELVMGKFDGVKLHDISEQAKDIGHDHNSHDANPINLAHENMPPVLLIHGEKDETVGPYHSERFRARLEQLNVPIQHIIYKGANHRQLVGGLSKLTRFLNPVYKDIQEFLKGL